MTENDYSILLVEDADHMVTTIEVLLGDQYDLRSAQSVAEARQELRGQWPDLMLLDLNLPDESGADLLEEIRETGWDLDVVVITASTDVDMAVKVMKLGARDYLQKPFEKEDLLLCVRRAYENRELQNEVDRLRSELYDPYHFDNIVAQSARMLRVLQTARKMAHSDANVLVTGPSGTGKELIARAMHCDGERSDGPFVAVNCAQFAGGLLESELFGHEKGAFTGATGRRKGRFELADAGTLFLDEVGDTSPEMQAKILRAVEMKRFQRVGGEETIEVDIRLISATNADLEAEVRKGNFREDLYYRLNVVRIEVPPLEDRKSDIEPLCKHFLAQFCAKTGAEFQGITREAMDALEAYDWKGNVRELQNVIETCVALEEGEWITTRYLPSRVLAAEEVKKAQRSQDASVLESVVGGFEKRFLEEQLRANDWNYRQTARNLGIHRNTVANKVNKYRIQKPC